MLILLFLILLLLVSLFIFISTIFYIFKAMKKFVEDNKQFDIVICDPPKLVSEQY